MSAMAPPSAIDIGSHHVTLRWDDGEAHVGAWQLRQSCRCAGCRRSGTQDRAIEAPAELSVTGAFPVGTYAVQFCFSDGHDRGIYPWSYLHELALPTGK
jgi:DUF971 family protein